MKLTARQSQVFSLVMLGSTDKEIADTLSISCATVAFHVGKGMGRLKARSRSHAVAILLRKKMSPNGRQR